MPSIRSDRLPNRWTEDDARRVLDECERSGMGLPEFARAHGLTPQRLYWWRNRLGGRKDVRSRPRRRATELVSLVPAEVVVPVEEASSGVVVRLPNGVAIEVGDATPAYVAALIDALVRGA